jgi:hypothetical protein
VRRAATRLKLTPSKTPFTDHKSGLFTKKLDKALPGQHTKTLYNGLSGYEAGLLSQLRTGRTRLNSYLFRIEAAESVDCLCGKPETISHFLFDCPRWITQRTALRDVARIYWGELSQLLGGYDDVKDESGRYLYGEKKKWKPNMALVRATITFAASTKRLDYLSEDLTSSLPLIRTF